MAETSLRVMNMVRRRILENPDVNNEELFAAAVELDPDMANLSLRQFNARYPLQVRRWELSQATRVPVPPREPGTRGSEGAAARRDADDLFGAAATRDDASEPGDEAGDEAQAVVVQRRAPRRKYKPREKRTAGSFAVSEAARRDIRQKLMQFAERVARAGSIPDTINALSTIDEVVDELVATVEKR